jgi:hypothetical protein
LADKSDQLILSALTRAAASADGLPLYSNGKRAGLFGGTASARQAAQRCKDEGYLSTIERQKSGKSDGELCAITRKGLAYLLNQVSPKAVLEEISGTLKDYKLQVAELITLGAKVQQGIEAFQENVNKILEEAHKPSGINLSPFSVNGSEIWEAAAIAFLREWCAGRDSSDCPLPELYRQTQSTVPDISIGHFHDGLRKLHDRQKVYLHPWTGPLYELPEPHLALMIGHEIAYYASAR